MQVHIVSRQIISPSSPTPTNLKTYKLSIIDQLSSRIYISRILFYAQNQSDTSCKSTFKTKNLKKSLSKILTKYYPFAGRLKDGICIECNDEGVELVEAQISSGLEKVLIRPDPQDLHQLFPSGLLGNNSYEGSLVVIQINHFQCGGIGISVCMSHKIGDGCTLSNFIKDWAMTVTENEDKNSFPFFISAEFRSCLDDSFGEKPEVEIKKHACVTRRFVFDASKINSLKGMVASFGIDSPTRVEVVSATLYKTAQSVCRKRLGMFRPSMMLQTVNMRGKMLPPLLKNSVGNFCWYFALSTKNEGEMNLGTLVFQMRKETTQFHNKYGTFFEVDKWFTVVKESMKEAKGLIDSIGDFGSVFSSNSMCHFPFYETDFGFGKPVWVAIAGNVFKNTFLLMDAPSGGGVEAWVTLDEENMAVFEIDEELLECCSLNPSVLKDNIVT